LELIFLIEVILAWLKISGPLIGADFCDLVDFCVVENIWTVDWS
jgi:hypothetical protein